MSPAEVTEKLGLHRMKDRSWYVHPRYVILVLFKHLLSLFNLACQLTCKTVAQRLGKGCLKDYNGFRVMSRTSRSKSRILNVFLYHHQLSCTTIPAITRKHIEFPMFLPSRRIYPLLVDEIFFFSFSRFYFQQHFPLLLFCHFFSCLIGAYI